MFFYSHHTTIPYRIARVTLEVSMYFSFWSAEMLFIKFLIICLTSKSLSNTDKFSFSLWIFWHLLNDIRNSSGRNRELSFHRSRKRITTINNCSFLVRNSWLLSFGGSVILFCLLSQSCFCLPIELLVLCLILSWNSLLAILWVAFVFDTAFEAKLA